MSLFKGENDTTKNSDNMLTMNQKNIPAARFSSVDVHFSSSLLLYAAHFCYISIFIFFLANKNSMKMCPSLFLVAGAYRRWYHVLFVNQIFAIATSSWNYTCVDHNVCLIIASDTKVCPKFGKIDNLQMQKQNFLKNLFWWCWSTSQWIHFFHAKIHSFSYKNRIFVPYCNLLKNTKITNLPSTLHWDVKLNFFSSMCLY